MLSARLLPLRLAFPVRKAASLANELGPYPKTEAERIRAAKKYNLIPEDYQPYPEEEGFGDYPNLKPIGQYYRDRYCDYDDPMEYRHYGEVYHRDYDLLVWERDNTGDNDKVQVNPWARLAYFLGLIALLPTSFWLFEKYRIHPNHNYKVRKFQNTDTYEFKDVPPPPAHH